MGIQNLHAIFGVQIQNDDMDAPALLGGITQQGGVTATQITDDITSGEVFPRFLAITGQKPTETFATLAIASALDVIALGGLPITSDANLGLNLFGYSHADGSSRMGGANHRKFNVKKGIIVPQRLVCEHRRNATISYLVLTTFDGTNDVLVVSDEVDVPDGLVDTERFTLAGVKIGSAASPPSFFQKTSFELDFGIKVEAVGGDSEIWDTFVSIRTTQPKITIKGLDLTWLAAAGIPLLGRAASHAYTTIYLRKRAQGATFVADNVAQHIAMTADGLAHIETAFEGNATEPQSANLVLPLRNDGTNDPIIFNTASTIT